MRKLIFTKEIKGTVSTGLIDISKTPPELFCLCDENKAKEILMLIPICNCRANHSDLSKDSGFCNYCLKPITSDLKTLK